MIAYHPGDVVLLMYPFTSDIDLTQWQSAGLPVRSVVRVHKLLTAEKTLIQRRVGVLTASDWKRVSVAVQRLWAPGGMV